MKKLAISFLVVAFLALPALAFKLGSYSADSTFSIFAVDSDRHDQRLDYQLRLGKAGAPLFLQWQYRQDRGDDSDQGWHQYTVGYRYYSWLDLLGQRQVNTHNDAIIYRAGVRVKF